MAKQRIEIEVLAPDAPEKCSGRQHSQYGSGLEHPLQAAFDYFKECCSDSFSSSELKLRFRENLGDRDYVSRAEVERWAHKTNYPRGSRTQSNAEIVIYFVLGCFILMTLHAFVNG